MVNVLYVHGYYGNSESRTGKYLKHALDESLYRVFHPSFDYSDPEKALDSIKSFIEDNKIDIVVSQSLGAFFCSLIYGFHKIVINPCLKPSIELPKIDSHLPEKTIEAYRRLECNLNPKNVSPLDKLVTYQIFGIKDELFSYKKEFENLFGRLHTVETQDGHKVSEKTLDEHVLPIIYKLTPMFVRFHNLIRKD